MYEIHGVHPHGKAEARITTRGTQEAADKVVANLKGFGYTQLRVVYPLSAFPPAPRNEPQTPASKPAKAVEATPSEPKEEPAKADDGAKKKA